MNHVIKSVRLSTPTVTLASPNQFGKGKGLRPRQAAAVSSKPDRDRGGDMDKAKTPQNPTEETGDVMSQSFGEGYATRSDEEGFGGTYGGNQSQVNIQADKEIHENHPAYDTSQGSEVKEKEKARHQTNASS